MEKLHPCLRYVDIFLPNFEEGKRLTGKEKLGEIAEVLLSYGVKTVVLKMGDKGCYLRTSDEEIQLPAYEVDAVDLTGAGDCFAAGFLTGICHGWNIEKCGMFANAAGAMCVTALGATTGVKTEGEILKFMESNRD